MYKSNYQRGYTLIELMIGMLVGLIVLSAVIYAFLTSIKANRDVRFVALVNKETTFLADMLSGEIRRIGYNTSSAADLSVKFQIPNSTCLVYTYDRNDGVPGLSDEGFYGFWQSGTKLYYGNFVSSSSCSATTSTAINSNSVNVSDLVFSASSIATASGNTSRTINYSFKVTAAADTAWNQTVSKVIKVRNDEM